MSIKLYYFDVRGLAEPIRIILSYGGLEFEDIRIKASLKDGSLPSIPPEIKEKCPWSKVPIVELDGKILAQSLAITRYFAKKFSLIGSDDFEAAECDEYVDTSQEFFSYFWDTLFMQQIEGKLDDDEKLKQKTEEVINTVDEKYLSKLNSIVEKNGGVRLVGKNLTWADIYLAHMINNVEIIGDIDLLKRYPALKSLSDSVFSEVNIQSWMDKRPATKY